MNRDNEFNEIKKDLIEEIRGMRLDMNIFMKTVNLHDEALYGNRTDKAGAMEDLRNLKLAEATRQRHFLYVWAAVIGVAVERAWSVITGWHKGG